MSWRDILGASPSGRETYPQYPHNTQNTLSRPNCADIANCADTDRDENESRLLEALARICNGLEIMPAAVRDALTREDIENWKRGDVREETLVAFAESLEQRREMQQGRRPKCYAEEATCAHCGPIWLWTRGKVLGCPWCSNRMAGRPIPRPALVRCGDCQHFEQSDHPNLGHCAQGQPENPAGLWISDSRACRYWIPTANLRIQDNGQ